MRFIKTDLHGAWLVEPERIRDERGYFARTWCAREFAEHGIERPMIQSSVSFNRTRGTLRGLHYQGPPSREGKLVRCVRGRIHDVIVDLRRDSATWLQHLAVGLDAAEGCAVYMPPGFAHGFQTLEDDCEVLYLMNDYYDPATSGGMRWNDPAFAIDWPIAVPASMSDRDRNYPDFDPDDFDLFSGYD